MAATLDAVAFTRFERDGWDRVTHAYHQTFGPVTDRAAGPLLAAARISAGSHVLDVASGPGYVTARALQCGARVTGVDLSPAMVALARSLHPGATFQVGDAAQLPFEDATFDAVVAGFLLPHLADHEGAVTELRRVLVPDGVVAVSTWDTPEHVPLLGTIVAAVAEVGAEPSPEVPDGPPFFRYSDPAALAGLLLNGGLADIEVTVHRITHRVPSAHVLWEGVLAGTVRTATLVARQPEEVREQIRAAFDRFAAPYRHADGTLELPTSILIGRGRP